MAAKPEHKPTRRDRRGMPGHPPNGAAADGGRWRPGAAPGAPEAPGIEDRKGKRENLGHGPRGMMLGGEKAKDFKGTFKRLMRYLRPRRTALLIIFIAAAVSTVFQIVSPKILGRATTTLFEGFIMKRMGIPGAGVDFDAILSILITLASLYVVAALFNYIQQRLMVGVAQKTVYDMREAVNQKLPKLPLKFYDSLTHGEILSRVTNDIDLVSTTLQQSVTQMITSIVTLIGVTIMMLSISPVLTLVVFISLPFSIFVMRPIIKRSQRYFKAQQKQIGRLNGHVEEMFGGHRIVKAYGKENDSVAEFDEVNAELYAAGWRAQFISGIIMPLMHLVNNIAYVLVSVIGAVFVTRQLIVIGDVQAFIQYARQFSQPLLQTANIANVFQSTMAAAERVFELLDETEEAADSTEPAKIGVPKGEVELSEVSFRYLPDTPLIDDMNISVSPGSTIAIVGPTGAGKTTLVNLLMRFYEVDKGRISIDGIDITALPRSDLRNLFGMVLQDTWLFSGTIRDNIAYGRDGITDDEVHRAASMVHADHFIRALPDGYNTAINEDGSNISQGQKQLLTIARAVLTDPAILILDEATSSVDTRTEALVQKAMTTLMQGRTNFVIAHRLSTIRGADLILVMNEGTIIETGTHQELLDANGFYADLYNSQFRGAELEAESA